MSVITISPTVLASCPKLVVILRSDHLKLHQSFQSQLSWIRTNLSPDRITNFPFFIQKHRDGLEARQKLVENGLTWSMSNEAWKESGYFFYRRNIYKKIVLFNWSMLNKRFPSWQAQAVTEGFSIWIGKKAAWVFGILHLDNKKLSYFLKTYKKCLIAYCFSWAISDLLNLCWTEINFTFLQTESGNWTTELGISNVAGLSSWLWNFFDCMLLGFLEAWLKSTSWLSFFWCLDLVAGDCKLQWISLLAYETLLIKVQEI